MHDAWAEGPVKKFSSIKYLPVHKTICSKSHRIAYAMVTVYGMNDKVGNISFYDPQQENTFTKPYSEETSKMIDEEVRKLIDVPMKEQSNCWKKKRNR